MASSEETFDLSELLVSEDDTLNIEQWVHIELKHIIDKDGDPAITFRLSSAGLDDVSLRTTLEVARGMVDDEEDEDDD